ncbi:MAG: hypothetical protein MUC47_05265 [Candidatus Kapabacteria bacterium]|jgi:hypothetical protein|nr:hypothetical protein [Candidatus Kapabacteria bacterium]
MAFANIFKGTSSVDDPSAALPSFPLKPGKSAHYMMAHVVLPFITFHRPNDVKAFWEGQGRALIHDVWRHQQASHEGWDGEEWALDGDVYVSEHGAQAVVVTFPRPTVVPEAHGVVIQMWPQRRYFVVELAHPSHIARHAQRGWVFLGNDVPRTAPTAIRGYLCEWCADGSRFNFGLEDWAVPSILQACMPGHDQWRLGGLWPGDGAPMRADPQPLDNAIASLIHAHYQAALRAEVPALEKASAVRGLLNDTVRRYGREYTEITLVMRDIIRLYVEGGDVDMARSLASSWVNFAHKYRGSRSPEVRLAYLAQAFVGASDTSMTHEQRLAWIQGRIAVSDHHEPMMRSDWPAADHEDLGLTAMEIVRIAGA